MNIQTADRQECSVLLVDDNEDITTLIKAHLKDPNVSLKISNNGREGIQAFKDGSFDLVLMDLQMPDVDGFEATRAIRGWERQKDLGRTPIAALTGSSSGTDVYEIFASGCDLYLPKPISRNVLLQTIAQYFRARRGGSATRVEVMPHTLEAAA